MVFQYNKPPAGETRFNLFNNREYYREVWQCQSCGHFINRLDVKLDMLYEGEYVETTYGNEGILNAYRKIMLLPQGKSDNYRRVKYILSWWEGIAKSKPSIRKGEKPSVLDVGSGLAVFLAKMKEEGWKCTALDPDPTAVEHASDNVGVESICGDFMKIHKLGRYDLVTFIKVLEHVSKPVEMLRKSRKHLLNGGMVYIEVPDGEKAVNEGPEREEFFIEHRCAFSLKSLNILIRRAGFVAEATERIKEPSGKYTLRAMLS